MIHSTLKFSTTAIQIITLFFTWRKCREKIQDIIIADPTIHPGTVSIFDACSDV